MESLTIYAKKVRIYKGCNIDCVLLKGYFQNIGICETQVCLLTYKIKYVPK